MSHLTHLDYIWVECDMTHMYTDVYEYSYSLYMSWVWHDSLILLMSTHTMYWLSVTWLTYIQMYMSSHTVCTWVECDMAHILHMSGAWHGSHRLFMSTYTQQHMSGVWHDSHAYRYKCVLMQTMYELSVTWHIVHMTWVWHDSHRLFMSTSAIVTWDSVLCEQSTCEQSTTSSHDTHDVPCHNQWQELLLSDNVVDCSHVDCSHVSCHCIDVWSSREVGGWGRVPFSRI